ncbi:MAG: metallophosphoesterase [Anaerolineales bacterium]|jgi:Icc-related predicted phosphoesterase
MTNFTCFFVSDLHGELSRYEKLFEAIRTEKPVVVFLGGDLLPSASIAFSQAMKSAGLFVKDVLVAGFRLLKRQMGEGYPRVLLILGNDDPRAIEREIIKGESEHIWQYMHMRRTTLRGFSIYGYALVPPTPFTLKDWEKYDLSHFVDHGCVPPDEGWRTVPAQAYEVKYGTIQEDLANLVGENDLSRAIFLFHAPPYQTALDRAGLDGRSINGVPVDVHVGSIAVKRFIEARQPLITLHGHIHESPRLTGSWLCKIGRTYSYSAAHDGPELSLIRFDPTRPEIATRDLI